jgi:spore coat protein H
VPRIFRLPATGWKRWLAILAWIAGSCFLLLVTLIVSLVLAWRSPRFQTWVMEKMMEFTPTPAEEMPGNPGLKAIYTGPLASADSVRTAADIFRPTNIWNVHLKFTEQQWKDVGYKRIEPVPRLMQEDGTVTLRNPKASRNGLAGAIGFDFPWSSADVEFGGRFFTNSGVRFKGNGTFMGAIRSYRKPWKIELDHNVKDQKFAGRGEFNLGNLSADFTCLSDALAYELHRDAGVPAPRTAYARVFLSIVGQETNRLIGPYVMVENPDGEWATERFGVKGVALFKPVTYELFSDLGSDWTNYHGIYDPKTKTTPEQRQRVMDFAKLVTHADDTEFAAKVGEFVDLDAAATFLAVEVLLSNYDGLIAQGQNFLLSLHPQSNKFGFVPWDLDHSWGEFPFMGTAEQRERADIWRPWAEPKPQRFLVRLFAVDAFKQRYRAELERLLASFFTPERLNRRVNEVAAGIRPVIAEWSTNRLAKLDTAVSTEIHPGPRDTGNPMDPNRPAWQLKRYIAARAQSVRAQLDGKEQGLIVNRRQN